MRTSEAIRRAADFMRNADHYQLEDMEARDVLDGFVTRWETTIDVLGEAEPGAVLNELLEYIKKGQKTYHEDVKQRQDNPEGQRR